MMKFLEIEQYTNDAPILRFLNKDGLMKTLGFEQLKIPRQRIDMHPSFLLRSLRQYKAMEDHRGDQYENEIVTFHPETGIPLSNINLNPIFISCWSTYTSTDLSYNITWEAFSDAVGAIESNIGEVEKVISWITPTPNAKEVSLAGNWGSLRTDATYHGKVIYYSPHDHNKIYNGNMIAPLNCFFKRHDPHQKEREYRFISLFGNHMHISPEMYCVGLNTTNYIKAIYLRKKYFTKDELVMIDAYYGNLVQIIE